MQTMLASSQQHAAARPTGQDAAPSASPTVVYHQPVCSGTIPVGRWGFSSAVVGSCMYVFGGVGPSILDDLAVLDVELMVWRSLTPSAARSKDRPDKLHAAAMCAVGSTLWMFGGQQGRKHLRTLYSLNTDVLDWKLVTPAGAQPAAREGHTLTTVASSGLVYLFGGQGKKFYNDMFILQPGGAEWVEVKPAGRAPSPRSGHSMVWDGGDRLVCFAGAASTTTDSALAVYSISTNTWSAVSAQGTAPSPRTRHTALLLGPSSMLVFGGCNSAGVFFNDAYLLNLDTWTWTRLQPLNPPPPPRYHHCCHLVRGKVVLYGGVNPKQAFDSCVLLQTSSGVQELSALAEELARMTGGGGGLGQPAAGAGSSAAALLGAAAAGAGGCQPLVGDLMKLQLRDLLVKRNMEELHVTAQQKADAVEGKLQQVQADKLALQKEVVALKLLKEEAEAEAQQLQQQLADTSKALARESAEHQATSAVLSDLRANLESREQQLGDARQLLDSMSAELGILASRLHRLQQERDALRAARNQEQQLRRQLLEQQQQASAALPPPVRSPRATRQLTPCQLEALQPLSGAAAAAAQLQIAGQASSSSGMGTLFAAGSGGDATDGGSTVDSQSFVECISEGLQQPPQTQQPPPQQQQQALSGSQLVPFLRLPRFASLAPASTSRGSSPNGLESDALLLAEQPDPAMEEAVPLCAHGQLAGACLLCMCTRFLEATAGSCSHWVPGSSLATAAARLSSSGNALPAPAAAAAAAAAAATGEAGAGSSSLVPDGSAAAPVPSAAGLATAAVAACASEAAQYRQYLAISELARNRLEAEHNALQQQVADLQRQVQTQKQELQVLQAHPAALTACSIEELTALEGSLEASTKAVRQVVLQRSIAEYQRQASADTLRCAVCMEDRRTLAFGCGHQTCDKCGDKITVCPFCRQGITAKIRLYE